MNLHTHTQTLDEKKKMKRKSIRKWKNETWDEWREKIKKEEKKKRKIKKKRITYWYNNRKNYHLKKKKTKQVIKLKNKYAFTSVCYFVPNAATSWNNFFSNFSFSILNFFHSLIDYHFFVLFPFVCFLYFFFIVVQFSNSHMRNHFCNFLFFFLFDGDKAHVNK